ncbi:hypothetical protein OGZ01_31545 (plasmid) [Vibrio harveyi]|nr:hypothetical protein [Vibrio harveyi]
MITENETRQARFKAIHDNCPGVMTKHLYRQIHCLVDADVKSVKFSWQRKDALHQPDKAVLISQMIKELERANPENELPLTQLIKKVASAPDMTLRIRRDVKVQPAYQCGKTLWAENHDCSVADHRGTKMNPSRLDRSLRLWYRSGEKATLGQTKLNYPWHVRW